MEQTSRLSEVREQIQRLLALSPTGIDSQHSLSTLAWVCRLKPGCDDALQIAALAHDIDRAVTGITESTHWQRGGDLRQFKTEHAIRSAQIISLLLAAHGCDRAFVEKVSRLVEAHEFGGDEESDLLRDADSLSFFEQNVESYLRRNGREKTQAKIRFMYDRLSEPAKRLVEELAIPEEVRGLIVG